MTAIISGIVVGIVLMLAGYFMCKHRPKNINALIGYRTPRAKKSQETWEFAHDNCGTSYLCTGLFVLVMALGCAAVMLVRGEDAIARVVPVLYVLQLICVIGPIVKTEKALKDNFNDDGTRKVFENKPGSDQ